MKAFLMMALVLAPVLMSAQAHAVEKCKFHLNDITKNELVATGSTRDEAQANAATKCFDMHQEMSMRRSGHGLQDDDQGVTIVNACTNVRCS